MELDFWRCSFVLSNQLNFKTIKNKIPDVFVNPDYTSDNDWVIYVTFHSKGVFFLGHATVKNISDTFFYLPSSFTEYRQSLKIDSLKSTFRNSEDTTLIWTDFE